MEVKRGLFVLMLILFSVPSYAEVDRRVDAALAGSEEVSVIVLAKDAVPVGDVESEFSSFDGFSATVSKSELERLRSDPHVKVVINGIRNISLDQSAGIVNATRVWGSVFNGTNITGKYETACVIDTGINYSHPDLGGCSDQSFSEGSCSKVLSGYNFVNTSRLPFDDHSQGHGTHVAGIIASTNTTYRGIAPGASLVALKACNAAGVCFDNDIIDSIDWCVYNASRFNISVISMSLGGGLYTGWCDGSEPAFAAAIDAVVAKNISVVVASGNSGSKTSISAPACIRNATAVGSTTKGDSVSSFSNRNSITDLLAPGSSINSLNHQGGIRQLSGTSMATPHASGAFLLIKQYMKVAYGNSTILPSEIESSLNFSGVLIDDSSGSGYYFPRIDAFSAIKRLDRFPPNITISLNTPENASNTSSIYIFVNITADEILSSAVLELDNGSLANYSMSPASGNLMSWNINQSASFGAFTYRVYGNDTVNWGVSETRSLQINNTAPAISWFSPNSSANISIAEPASQLFNVTYYDAESVPSISWLVNGSESQNSGNFTYSGNYSSSGHYNITVIVSDSLLSAFQSWILEINNTNRVPSLSFANQSLVEDSSVSFSVSASDPDNDSIAFSVNDSRFSVNSSGTVSFSSPLNFFGTIQLNVSAADIIDNSSGIIFVTVTPVNDPPVLSQPANVTFNETEWANLTFSAGDVENDSLVFALNDSRFSVSGNNASFLTALNDSGTYHMTVNVSDGNLSAWKNFTLAIIDQFDSDGDSIPDVYDSDDDNDGIPDDIDNLIGNRSFISSGTVSINVTINNNTVLNSFNGTNVVELKDANITLVEFSFNFSTGTLNLANITYERQRGLNHSGYLLARGVFLQEGRTKTIFLDNINQSVNTVCIRDAEIASISEISASCNSTNETLVECNGALQGGYTCSLVNGTSKYRITGLRFSGAVEQCPDSDNDSYYDSSCGSGNDCNDLDRSVNPAASEICGNSVDEDCDGSAPACPVQSSSSGGGGGGGGGSAKPVSGKASQFFDLIPASEERVVKTRNSAFSVSRILFAPESQVSRLTVSVELVNASSQDLENVYQYFNITLTGDIAVLSAGIDFSVNKSWYSENVLDPSSTKLLRFNSGWESYPAILLNNSDSQYHYSASVPGFSVFAVSAGQFAEKKALTSVIEEAIQVEKPDAPIIQENSANGSVEAQSPQARLQPYNIRLLLALVLLIVGAFFAAISFNSFRKV